MKSHYKSLTITLLLLVSLFNIFQSGLSAKDYFSRYQEADKPQIPLNGGFFGKRFVYHKRNSGNTYPGDERDFAKDPSFNYYQKLAGCLKYLDEKDGL
ncbi:unnamed protein product [Gordionus sp. m RMFG-2023]